MGEAKSIHTTESVIEDQPAHRVGYTAAAVLLGQAIWFGLQKSHRVALLFVCLAVGSIVLGWFSRRSARAVGWLLIIGIALGFYRLPMIGLFLRVPASRSILMPFVALAAVALALTAILLLSGNKWSRSFLIAGCFPLLVAVHFLMGVWYLGISSDPLIDVYLIQRLGCEALSQPHDPYTITFPDIYGPSAHYYPASSIVNGQVQCGYFYPPLSLLLDLPGFAAGDMRYSHLASLSLSALLLGYMRRRRGRTSRCAAYAPAVLLLFTPGVFRLLENAWIEPLLLLMLCLVVFLSSRGWRTAAGAALGLLLAGKQYVPLALPAVALLLPRPWQWRDAMRMAIVAMIAGGAVTLPFVLWNPAAFFHSLTSIYVGILRPDSTSFLPMIAQATGRRPSLLFTAAAAVPAILLVLWRAPRTPGGFAAGTAIILTCVFAFSTQAFANYYFLSTGALCAAIAAADYPLTPSDSPDYPKQI